MTVEVMIPNAIASFVKLAEAQQGDYGNTYRMNLIVPANFEHTAKLEAAMLEAAKGKWGDKGAATYENLKDQDRVALKRRPAKNGEGKIYEGYEGMWFISAARKEEDGRPTVFTATNVKVENPAEIGRLIYSGCKVHAKLRLWAQDNKGGKRVNAEMVGLMFAGDGKAFSGQSSVATADDFAGMAQAVADAEDLF